MGIKLISGFSHMASMTSGNITTCRQCGTCCRKGGPALHRDDLAILQQGHIGCQQLITIRKGEPAYDPIRNKLVATTRELIKIKGRSGEWVCCFFDPQQSVCAIYTSRPLECRLLKCWDTADIMAVINRDTISRQDIINLDDPILTLIKQHVDICPGDRIEEVITAWSTDLNNQELHDEITKLIRADLAFRTKAIFELKLPSAVELFVLGRPLFKLLAPFGVAINEKNNDIQVVFQNIL